MPPVKKRCSACRDSWLSRDNGYLRFASQLEAVIDIEANSARPISRHPHECGHEPVPGWASRRASWIRPSASSRDRPLRHNSRRSFVPSRPGQQARADGGRWVEPQECHSLELFKNGGLTPDAERASRDLHSASLRPPARTRPHFVDSFFLLRPITAALF